MCAKKLFGKKLINLYSIESLCVLIGPIVTHRMLTTFSSLNHGIFNSLLAILSYHN